MAHRFFVVSGEVPGDQATVYYVTDEQLPKMENFDPRESDRTKDRIVHEDVIEVGAPCSGHTSWEEWPAIQAIANLDNARPGRRPIFRPALAKIYEMGMAAQRELDRRGVHEANRDVDQ